MYIHNFYGDLLLSVRTLFDNYVFQNRNYAKRYEFNMGNRAIQLPYDYKTNYEFPNLIVTLNDDVPSYGQRPEVSQKIPGFNLDQTPVLYDQTTGITLLVQEEMVNVPITIAINCESQFQAKEVAIMVKRWLPINKFISFLTMTSYLEISPEFLSKTQFDPATHTIANLYTKLNKRTGDVEYCYSIQYNPMIRLDSISTSIPDSTQRSFVVLVDITYMIQMPLYMFSDNVAPTMVEKIDLAINPSSGFEPISDYPSSKLINYLNSDIETLEKGVIRRTYLVSDPTSVVQKILTEDSVELAPDQVTKTSTGDENIVVTRGVDNYLYITVGDSETQYKTNIDEIPPPAEVDIPIDTDQHFAVSKDIEGNITIVLQSDTNGTLDSVELEEGQTTATSTGGQDIVVTKGDDGYLHITVNNTGVEYATKIDEIPPPAGVNIPLSTDQYLFVSKDNNDNITTTLQSITEELTITFNPTEFPLTTDFSYNLIKGNETFKDYTYYRLDLDNNSITFIFNESQYPTFIPSLSDPLFVQFYLKNAKNPHQFGGVMPKVGLMKVFNITSTAAEMTWTSDEETTTQIEYGITVDYGSLSVLKDSYTHIHKVVLTRLESNTLYHYRVKVKNSDNVEYLSGDYTFTTLV